MRTQLEHTLLPPGLYLPENPEGKLRRVTANWPMGHWKASGRLQCEHNHYSASRPGRAWHLKTPRWISR